MQSPYSKLYGTSPDLLSLGVFGSAIYPLLKPYNAHKLEPRPQQCVFLGFLMGYKGVYCYNSQNQKILILDM